MNSKSFERSVLEGGVDPAEGEAQLATLEAGKRVAQRRVLELLARDANRKPLPAEVESLRQRLRKNGPEIEDAKRQIVKDENLAHRDIPCACIGETSGLA